MRTSDELVQSRRRGSEIRDDFQESYQAPTSAVASLFYLVVAGDDVFPTTGLNTVFNVQLLAELPVVTSVGPITPPGAGGQIFKAVNFGDSLPIQDRTIVRCDQVDGQLFFTYRGNGST